MAPRWLNSIPVLGRLTNTASDRVSNAVQRVEIMRQNVRKPGTTTPPKPRAWQRRAWDLHDDVGEAKAVHRYRAQCLSRVRWYVGIRLDADENPVPIRDALDDDRTPPGLSPALVDELEDLLARVRSPIGGQANIRGELTTNLDVAGECFLVGEEDPEAGTETWDVLSIDEIRHRSGRWQRVTGDGGAARDLAESAIVLRIWNPHPRWSNQADSLMRGVMDRCEELLALQSANIAVANSQLAHGDILYWDKTLNPVTVTRPSSGSGQTEPGSDPAFDAFTLATITPLEDPEDVSSVAPIIVRGEGKLDGRIEWITRGRGYGEGVIERETHLVRRIAQGLEAPPERVTGLGESSTYANALLVTRDEFAGYLEPTALGQVEAITEGWLRPGMQVLQVPQPLLDQIVVWYDASPLVQDPDVEKKAGEDHDRGLLSDEATRRIRGWTETDAPADEELDKRAAQGRLGKRGGGQSGPGGTPAPADGEEQNQTRRRLAALTAAGSSRHTRELERLGARLSTIDRQLTARLVVATDNAVQDALRRAGSKLRAGMQGSAHAAIVRGADPLQVGRLLGPGVVESLEVDVDDLFAGSFDQLGERFDSLVTTAQQRALVAVGAVPLADGQTDWLDDELPPIQARQDSDRREAWLGLLLSLLTLSRARLYDPAVDAPPSGEFDSSISVAPDLVRRALSRAGGTSSTVTGPAGGVPLVGEAPAGGVATGDTLMDLARAALRATMVGWTWEWGALGEPTTAFEPHQDLDGVEFEGWRDDALLSDGGWPFVSHYYPGDHAWCACSFTPRLAVRA